MDGIRKFAFAANMVKLRGKAGSTHAIPSPLPLAIRQHGQVELLLQPPDKTNVSGLLASYWQMVYSARFQQSARSLKMIGALLVEARAMLKMAIP